MIQGIGRMLALALASWAALGMPAAGAATLYSQPLAVPNPDGGPFSFPAQQIADEFRFAAAGSVNALVWYGDSLANTFPGSMSFTVRLFEDAGVLPQNTPFYAQTVTAAATATNFVVQGSAFVFRFAANLPAPLTLRGETDYWLSILDNAAPNPLTLFRWANGASAAGDSPNAFRIDDGAPWNPLFAGDSRAQAAYDLLGDPVVLPVPEPGALALIGLALAGVFLVHRRAAR